jgi:hypothetical protein
MSGQLHALAAVSPGISPPVLIGLGDAKGGLDVENNKKKPFLCRESRPGRPVVAYRYTD